LLGHLKFLAPDSAPPIFGPSSGGAAARSTLVGDYEDRAVEIADGRKAAEAFDLDTHGFALATLPPVGDLYDDTTLSRHGTTRSAVRWSPRRRARRVSKSSTIRGARARRMYANVMRAASRRRSSTTTTRRGRR